MKNAFEKYHPAVNFVFFIGAIVFGMFFVHPAFLLISVVASSLYYILLKGRDGIRSWSYVGFICGNFCMESII